MEFVQKMTPIATTSLPLFLFLLCRSAASRTFVALLCPIESGNYSPGSNYPSNLSRLLLRRVYVEGRLSFFYNVTEGDAPDTVYGLFLCRPDVAADVCLFCINFAATEILGVCPGRKNVIIWYDECLMRYSNRSFFSVMESEPPYETYHEGNPSYPDIFGTTLALLVKNATDSAVASDNHYAASYRAVLSFMEMNIRAQCTPDLSRTDCRTCLRVATDDLGMFSSIKQFSRVFLPSCYVQYEIYDSRPQAPLPGPATNRTTDSSGGRKKTWVRKWIVTSAIAGVFLPGIFAGSCVLAKLIVKIKEDRETRREVQSPEVRNGMRCKVSKDELQGKNLVNSGDMSLMRLNVIRTATNSFSDDCKLGQGGFGPVYKGTLADGREIAVKRLSRTSGQGMIELENEVTVIARLQHRNLVKLLGYCLEEHEKLLIYEYMPNKSLDFFLFDPSTRGSLNWTTRFSIINGVARGLLYLHEDSRLRIIHRDLKASNILLDHEMNPKISDFGLARIFRVDQDEANTNRVVGTYGYMAPEYAMGGLFSIKSDVFSFGVLVLEIVSGSKNSSFHRDHVEGESLVTFAWKLWNEGRTLDLFDGSVKESFDEAQALKCVHIALLCVQQEAADRPTMCLVTRILGGDSIALPMPLQPTFSTRPAPVDELDSKRPPDERLTANDVTLSAISARVSSAGTRTWSSGKRSSNFHSVVQYEAR